MPIQIPETEIIFKSQIFATRQFDGIFRNCNCDEMRDHPETEIIFSFANKNVYNCFHGKHYPMEFFMEISPLLGYFKGDLNL